MDHKYVRYTNPALGQEDLRPARKRKRGSDWEMMKADIYRIYMDEDNDLKTTKTMISLIPGFESFNACDRTWKEQLDAWHFVKKVKHEDMEIMIAKEQQRASEGKSTEFTYWQRRVEPEKLERAKKRGNARELSPSVATPRYIMYRTPRSVNEDDSSEEVCESTMIRKSNRSLDMDKCSEKISEGAESLQFRGPTNLDNEELFSEAFSVEFSAYLTPLFQSSFLSCAISDSTTGSPPSIEDITTATASIFGATSISLIDRYTCDENFPWNLQFPSHRLDDHDTMLARLRQVLLEITDLLSHPQQGSSEFSKHSTTHFFSPDVLYIGIQFSLETSPGIGDEAKDQASESTILEELFDLSGKLAICQINNGEFEPPTLELEFEVGKSCHRNGDFEEAEHHCRRILQRHAHIDVQSFLGMVLSDASRTDEGRYLLFRALTGFITEFAGSPMCTNSRRFDPIQSLYLKVIPRDWTFMDLVMIDLMTTIEEATTKNSVDQFFQVLYAHGYSMAHQCFLHGMVRSAEYMYEDLLNPGRHLNTWLHGVEEAKAHQRFGIVLKNQRRLESSADQILLAYECVLNSGVHDSQFIELLQSDYMELVSLLPPTPLESTPMEPLQAKLKMVLDLLQNKGPEPQYAASDISCHSDINESLHEFPQSLATLPSSRPSISNTSFELSDLPLRGVNLRRGGASRTSTSGFSTEPSYKIGVSYTNVSGCTGVSISGLSGLSGL